MWNMLIVIVIVIVLSFFNAKYHFIENPAVKNLQQKTEVNNVVNDAVNITNEARKQQQEQVDAANN